MDNLKIWRSAKHRKLDFADNIKDLEVRDLELGLVDFPSLVDGEPAYLSWRLGEDRVGWWHPADKGFSDRTPVNEPSLELPPYLG